MLSKNLLQSYIFEFVLANLQYSDAYIQSLQKTQTCPNVTADQIFSIMANVQKLFLVKSNICKEIDFVVKLLYMMSGVHYDKM